MSVTGGCVCGAVRFEVNGKLRDVVYCHCSRCRKWHGHMGAYTRTPKDGIVWREQRGLKWHQMNPEVRRGFCMECGSTMFVASRGDYYAAPTDVVAYDEYPPPKR